MTPAPSQQTRLYLAIPATADVSLTDTLSEILLAADIAAVLLRMANGDPRSLTDRIKAFAPVVQSAGAALLLDGHADLVARGGADGAHLSGIAALQEALPSLRPQRIAGVGALASRHDAMVAAEAGADYVMFGDPDDHGKRPSIDAIAERVAWWAEVFEVPCVAYAGSLEECAEFAAAGSDFVLVEDLVWNDPRGAGPALMDAGAAIGQNRGSMRPQSKPTP